MSDNKINLPWFFRPLYASVLYLFLLLLGAAIQPLASGYVAALIEAAGFVLFGFHLFWSYLLYEYLAEFAPAGSTHRPGRNKMFALLLAAAYGASIVLTMTGVNTPAPNEPADNLVFPLFALLFILNWRACSLLVEIEEDLTPAISTTLSFFAIFYLPISVWWFYGRLKKLRLRGKI